MSFKRGIAVAVASGTIATFGITALTPKLASVGQKENQQGGHAQQVTNEQLRQEGNAAGTGNYLRQFDPVEPRPREPEPRLPFRILP